MSEGADPVLEDDARAADRRRARRRAEVFGDTLPETTRDEREVDPREERDGDAWLRAQVPPHHGE